MILTSRSFAITSASRCGADVAHHFARASGGGGTAIKAHDTFTVPLCNEHHGIVHQHGQLPYLSADETEAHFFRVALTLVTGWLVKQEEKKHHD